MRKRRTRLRERMRWTVKKWERGWQLAMSRLEGAPEIVSNNPIFQDYVMQLDEAFADGNGLQFELGLNGLLDFCANSIKIGDCEQWWKKEEIA